MKNIMDLAIYIVTEAKRKKPEADPSDMAVKAVRGLKLRSMDAESLMTGIWITKKFGPDQDLIEQARANVGHMPEYEEVIRDL
jgi:hypothetical protein